VLSIETKALCLTGLCTKNQSQTNNVIVKCIQSEREALVSFKAGVIDFLGKLSCWVGEDCYQWGGRRV